MDKPNKQFQRKLINLQIAIRGFRYECGKLDDHKDLAHKIREVSEELHHMANDYVTFIYDD